MEEAKPLLVNGCMVDGDYIPCVFDDPDYNVCDCNYATQLHSEGKSRDDCQYWKPGDMPVDVRQSRLLLLEQVAEAYLKEHQGMKDFTAGFGPKSQCDCPFCVMARQALELKDSVTITGAESA